MKDEPKKDEEPQPLEANDELMKQIADFEYFFKKLLEALGPPKTFLGYENEK